MSDINDDDDDDHYNDLSDLSDHDDSPINNNNNKNKNYDNDNDDDDDTNEEVNRDPFGDDAHLLQLRIEASSLTLDEVGYDRDLNRINNPNPTDRKTLFKATLLRKQVDQIKGIVTPEDLERIQKGEKKSHSRRRRGGGAGNGIDDRNINNNNETASPTILKREIYQAPTNSNRRRNSNVDGSNEVKAEKVYDRRRQIPSFDNVQSNNTFPQPPTFETSNGRRRGGRGRKDKKKDQSVMIKGIMQNPNRDMMHSYNHSAIYLNPGAPEFTPPMIPKTADYANNTLFLNPAAPEFTPTFASKT